MKPVALNVTVDAAYARSAGPGSSAGLTTGCAPRACTGREKNGAVDYRPKFIGLVFVWTGPPSSR